MKKELQIIGACAVGKDKIKVSCIPYTTPGVRKKEASLMSIAMGGAGIQDIMQEAQAKKTEITKFFVDLDEWRTTYKNKILTKIELEVRPLVFLDDK